MSAHVNEGAREAIDTATSSVTHHWKRAAEGGATVTFTEGVAGAGGVKVERRSVWGYVAM